MYKCTIVLFHKIFFISTPSLLIDRKTYFSRLKLGEIILYNLLEFSVIVGIKSMGFWDAPSLFNDSPNLIKLAVFSVMKTLKSLVFKYTQYPA